MGDGHRAAGFNLFFEERDDGAIATQYISKADGYELGARSVLVFDALNAETGFPSCGGCLCCRCAVFPGSRGRICGFSGIPGGSV